MTKLVQAEGAILQRIVATTPLVAYRGLSREAFAKYDAAQAKTPWALRHRRRFALMQADDVLASAERYDLTGRLDRLLARALSSRVRGLRLAAAEVLYWRSDLS
jgi:hypothetical protein